MIKKKKIESSRKPPIVKKVKLRKVKLEQFETLNKKKLIQASDKNHSCYSKLFQKVEDNIKDELCLGKEEKIILAVSGGVDSVVLMDVFTNLAKKYHFTLNVAHFNHNLRGEESNKDFSFVKNLAETYNVPFYYANGNVKSYAEKNSLSIEHAARILRYNFFEKTAITLKSLFIATAHTSDDLTETFLINLIRGSGLTGLSSIPVKRQLAKNVNLIRPFLRISKKEIIEYAKLRKLEWREDSSNSILVFTRNKVRNELIPFLINNYSESISDTINRTSHLIGCADKFITDIIKKYKKNIIADENQHSISLKINLLQTFDDFIQGEILHYFINLKFKTLPLSLNKIDRIISLLSSPVGSVCEISKNLVALRDRKYLIISSAYKKQNINSMITRTGNFNILNYELSLQEVAKKNVVYNNNPNVEYFDMDLIPVNLIIRSWEAGDSFQPIGLNKGTVKISDYLINQKINLFDKQNVLLLATKKDIIWICGRRASEKFKITDGTKKYLKVEFIIH